MLIDRGRNLCSFFVFPPYCVIKADREMVDKMNNDILHPCIVQVFKAYSRNEECVCDATYNGNWVTV